MVFLVAVVTFIEKNITAVLVFVSLIEGYILTASNDAIADPSHFISNSQDFPSGWMLGQWKRVNESPFTCP